MKRIIGLMGNSGSGKSTIAAYLKKLGAHIVDADEIAHHVCDRGQPCLKAVRKAFGDSFFLEDGSLNRRLLGSYVFQHPAELKRLEALLHPLILEKTQQQMDAYPDGIVVVDCALLVQTGLHQRMDEVWLVKAPEDSKISRICSRDEISCEDAANRLRSQISDDELVRYADQVILNDAGLDTLYAQAKELLDAASQAQ